MKRYYLTIFLFAILLQSCETFLEETPYNKVTVGNFYATKEGVALGVNGLYSELREFYGKQPFVYLCEAPSDIFRAGNSMQIEFRNWTIDATSNDVYNFWAVCYRTINQANAVAYALENNKIPDLSELLRQQYLGEVKFIRAHMYYHLVQQFGDVPLKTQPTATVETESYRTPAAEVWDAIIDDLEFCIENLPESYTVSELGRVTKYAAMHHLARVYLTLKRSNDEIQQGRTLAESVINSGEYQLVESHKYLWDMADQKNSEVIFSVLFTQNIELNGAGNQLHVLYTASYSDHYPAVVERVIEYGRPFNRARPSWFFLDLYDESIDQRWEDCFRTNWNVTRITATDVMFNPVTKQNQQVTWNKGELAMTIPKKLWTRSRLHPYGRFGFFCRTQCALKSRIQMSSRPQNQMLNGHRTRNFRGRPCMQLS